MPPPDLKLMLVEDDSRVVEIVRRGLAPRCAKFRQYSTISGARGALAGGTRFDLILLDLELPDGDGREFARQYRADGGQTPIIILTGHDSVRDRVAGLQSGADDYLPKPFDVSELELGIVVLVFLVAASDDHGGGDQRSEREVLHERDARMTARSRVNVLCVETELCCGACSSPAPCSLANSA